MHTEIRSALAEKRIVIICGPTASGKSHFAENLANKNENCIINADSAQVYREIPITAALPQSFGGCDYSFDQSTFQSLDQNSTTTSRYSLYAIWSIFDDQANKNVKKWYDLARIQIEDEHLHHKTPIVVGGSGMYINSLIFGINPMPPVPRSIQDKYIELISNGSKILSDLYKKLRFHDPELADRIKPNDKQRIIRGLSFFDATNTKLSHWQKKPYVAPYNFNQFDITLISPPRQSLHRNIEQRLEKMLDQGMIAEIEKLILQPQCVLDTLPKIIGIKEVASYIAGDITLNRMKELIIYRTRQYAKRQDTWFRNKVACLPNVHLICQDT